jgi:hypothetical protein
VHQKFTHVHSLTWGNNNTKELDVLFPMPFGASKGQKPSLFILVFSFL